jgi:hypothetical protein
MGDAGRRALPYEGINLGRSGLSAVGLRKRYRVGPKVSSWPNILTENPYERPQVGPTFGATL